MLTLQDDHAGTFYEPAKHAELLAAYCLDAQPGQRIQVSATTLALPLVEALHRELLAREARPVVRLEYPGQQDDLYCFASADPLDNLHPADLNDMEATDATLRILTPRRRCRTATLSAAPATPGP